MNNNKWIIPILLAAALAAGSISGCGSTPSGQGVQIIEDMNDAQFNKLKLYLGLGVKITATRLLDEKQITKEELQQAKMALVTLKSKPVIDGAASFIQKSLLEAGLKKPEIELLLVVVEQEILLRGPIGWIDEETGGLKLSDRTKQLLDVVISALDAAGTVTYTEVQEANTLEAELNGKIINR